ncbi:MAG: hypothetical protein ACPGVB_02480 [Chitinophagales bacterium]
MNRLTSEKIEFRKIRNFSEHINAAANFINQNFAKMLKILLQVAGIYVALGLATIMVGFYLGFMDLFTIESIEAFEALNLELIGGISSIAAIFFMIGNVLYTAATYRYILEYIYRDDYDQLNVSNIKQYLGRDSKIVFFTYLSLFFLGFCSFFIIIIPFIGVLTFFFGWIYLIVPLSFIFLLRIHEKIGFMKAIKRCRYLLEGHWWQTFGLYCITGLIMYSISISPSLFSGFGYDIGELLNSSEISTLLFGIFYIISVLVSIITSIAFSVVIAFRYFSLLEVKEGVNMMERIQELGK